LKGEEIKWLHTPGDKKKLEEGSNIKYFHAKANERRKKNR
jgi:hypothetical protein